MVCQYVRAYDMVTKKNASTANRDVLNLVCYHQDLLTPMVAHRANLYNMPVVYHV